MSNPIRVLSERYIALLEESITEREKRLGKGNCEDFSDYRFQSGQIVALEAAKKMFLNEVQNVSRDEDER